MRLPVQAALDSLFLACSFRVFCFAVRFELLRSAAAVASNVARSEHERAVSGELFLQLGARALVGVHSIMPCLREGAS